MIETKKPMQRRGDSMVGVILAVVCVLVLVVVVLSLLLPTRGRPGGLTVKNESQARQIHQTMLAFANDQNGYLPVPGLINRLKDPYLDRETPGAGPEDESINTTANLYSALIAQEWFNTDLPVSPLERNPVVTEDIDYDYDTWQPGADQFWDPAFTADLVSGSNASYAHRSLAGLDRKMNWSARTSADVIQIGNRGPVSGVAAPSSLACEEYGTWAGTLVFADNHTERLEIARGQAIQMETMDKRDNPFAADPVLADRDAFIAFTRRVLPVGPEYQHD